MDAQTEHHIGQGCTTRDTTSPGDRAFAAYTALTACRAALVAAVIRGDEVPHLQGIARAAVRAEIAWRRAIRDAEVDQ